MKKTTKKTAPKPARKPSKAKPAAPAKPASGSVLANLYVKKPRSAPPAPVVAKRPPPPPPPRKLEPPIEITEQGKPQAGRSVYSGPQTYPVSDFPEGSQVSIPGLPDMQGIRIEKITESCVYVSSTKAGQTTISRGTPVVAYERAATSKDPGLTVIAPDTGASYSSAAPGRVTRTTLPAGKAMPPPPPGKRQPPTPPGARPAAPSAPRKRDGVCGFIDEIIMQGGRTKEQILELVLAQFPGRDPKATLTTIGIRPSHIRAKGGNPPPFVK